MRALFPSCTLRTSHFIPSLVLLLVVVVVPLLLLLFLRFGGTVR